MGREKTPHVRAAHKPAACAPAGDPPDNPRADACAPRATPHNRGAMRSLRLGLAQINPTVGDLDGNHARIVEAIGRARALGAEVLAFPELAVTGYPPEDLLLQPSFVERAMERTRDLLPHTRGHDRRRGLARPRRRPVQRGRGAARRRAGPASTTSTTCPTTASSTRTATSSRARERSSSRCGGVTLGVNICEDIWYPGGPGRGAGARGRGRSCSSTSPPRPTTRGKARRARAHAAPRAPPTTSRSSPT